MLFYYLLLRFWQQRDSHIGLYMSVDIQQNGMRRNCYSLMIFNNYGYCLWGSNVLASSARVQTHNCVNLGSKTEYWIAPKVYRKFVFKTVVLSTTQLFYFS